MRPISLRRRPGIGLDDQRLAVLLRALERVVESVIALEAAGGGRTGSSYTRHHNDLERASETVRPMVCRFGMSEALGPVTFGRAGQSRFLAAAGLGEERNFSEETARQIDAEVRKRGTEASASAGTPSRARRPAGP